MANQLVRIIRRNYLSSLLKPSPSISPSFRSISNNRNSIFEELGPRAPISPSKPRCVIRSFSYGSVNLVISEGKTKFETHEVDPPKKEKWKTKKRLKQQRMREKQKRKSANKKDPRCIGIKGKKMKQRFANAEERIKYKLEKAKIKEGLLIERLKRYEVPKLQGPVVRADDLTGEERFYMKKMAQKRSNYAPVGRRGVFGGVILNMHMHWKKHETVKVICKPCKPGQVHEYAQEIARLSGGIPIQIYGDDTIIFYRGKNYVQPKVMSPIDTLSKKKALEKSKYEQSLESVRRFIAIAEKELELYYRHVALYGDPSNRSSIPALDYPRKSTSFRDKVGIAPGKENFMAGDDSFAGSPNAQIVIDSKYTKVSEYEDDYTDQELSENEDLEDESSSSVSDSDNENDNYNVQVDDESENSTCGGHCYLSMSENIDVSNNIELQ